MASLGGKFKKKNSGGHAAGPPRRCLALVLLDSALFAYVRPKSGPVKQYLASTSQNPLATVASAAHF